MNNPTRLIAATLEAELTMRRDNYEQARGVVSAEELADYAEDVENMKQAIIYWKAMS